MNFGAEVFFLMAAGSVVLGPKRLVEVNAKFQQKWGELKKVSDTIKAQLKSELEDLDGK